jgi:hypothetical protein
MSINEALRARAREHDDRCVMSWVQFVTRNNLSKATAHRLRKAGLGPKVVQLSTRRIGVTFLAEREWQDGRTVGSLQS